MVRVTPTTEELFSRARLAIEQSELLIADYRRGIAEARLTLSRLKACVEELQGFARTCRENMSDLTGESEIEQARTA